MFRSRNAEFWSDGIYFSFKRRWLWYQNALASNCLNHSTKGHRTQYPRMYWSALTQQSASSETEVNTPHFGPTAPFSEVAWLILTTPISKRYEIH